MAEELTTNEQIKRAAERYVNHMPVIELMQMHWETVVDYYIGHASQDEIEIFLKDYNSEH